MDMSASQYAVIAAFMSALAAGLSAVTAVRNYRLARSIQQDAKADERIVIGIVVHPTLRTQKHADCVLQIPIFNKSKRKATVTDLTVYDHRNQPIPVAWSGAIDELGTPQAPANLVGVTDSHTLFVRRNDGERFDYARILFADSFSSAKNIVIFDPASEWERGNK
ncbi:MAG: hypothetical protein WA210_10600 [Burkholderiaceae bacterium]